VKDMNTLSVSRHVCGHYCVRSSAEKNRRLIKPLHFVCYACRNVPGAKTCRSCKVRGEWLDRQKIDESAATKPTAKILRFKGKKLETVEEVRAALIAIREDVECGDATIAEATSIEKEIQILVRGIGSSN
jgi:hypothetical protein